MDNMRLPRPAIVRIERDHGSRSARVIVDGNDVSRHVTAVSWSMEAGRLPRATITFMDVEIVAAAEDVESWSMSSRPVEPETEMPFPRFATDGDRERFAGMFGDKLDAWFTPEFAEYVRRGPQPVVPRERVEFRGEPFAPVKLDPAALEELTTNEGFEAPLG